MEDRGKSRVVAYGPTTLAAAASGAVTFEDLPAHFNEANLIINVTAAGGTVSLVCTYQISPDGGTTWIPHTTFTTMTAIGKQLKSLVANIGAYGRVYYILTGTTPSVTFSFWFEGKK